MADRNHRCGIQFGLVLLCVVMIARSSFGQSPHIVFLSFNIRGDFDQGVATDKSEAWIAKSGEHRRELVASVISACQPDIIGVQEAYQNQMDDLQAALPGYEYYGVGRDDGRSRGEQSAIFYRADRFERTDADTFWLSNSPAVAGSVYPGAATVRIASWVKLIDRRDSDREFYVFNTHWDHVSQDARLHSAKLLRKRCKSLAGDSPVVVLGDLNADEENDALAILCGATDDDGWELIDSYREVIPKPDPNEATFNAFEGKQVGSRIDFILHTRQFRATRAAIDRTVFDGRYPSDHYPVTAELVPVP